jgi:transposase
MCPGNHESAGKHYGGTTRKGDPWLRGALGEAAASAARTKNTYLQTRYRRLAARRGKNRALVAVGHSILIAIWHMISNDIGYRDLGADHFLAHTDPTRQARRLVNQLRQIGYQAVVTPVP